MSRDRSRPERQRTAADRQRDREERERRRAPHVDLDELHAGGEPLDELPPDGSQAEPAPHLAPPVAAAPGVEYAAAPPPELARPPAPASPRARAVSAGPNPDHDASGREPHARRRSPLARVAAVLALVVAIGAVFLLLRSLTGSKSTPSATVPTVVTVLIPEGKTRAQIAQIASARHLKGSYTAASRRSSVLDPAHYGAPHGTPDLEGFLFPATYELNPGDSVSRLVREQLAAFGEHFGSREAARAHALHVTPYQLLTVASMVEREAQAPSDRPKIAAVIYNRLGQGMALGIDATIYYAVELQKHVATYTRELTESQLHIDSPYNTRTHTGLPPTPISNPGVASIQAAAHPSHAGYLYYVAGADGCGEQIFSTTLAAFESHVAAYQAAVKNNGGHPPVCKKK